MQRLGGRRVQPRMGSVLGAAAAAVIFTAALCQSGVANAGPHGGGGGGFHGGGGGGFMVAGSMAADSEGSTGAVFTGGGFTPAVSMASSTVTGSMTVGLEGFAVASACWDGPTTLIHTGRIIILIHTDRIIIRTTVTARANTATHTPGITAPIPPVITLM
jgi:hypothetical protein